MPLRPIAIALLPLALAGCMSPRPPLSLPDASVIGFDGQHAVPPDCAKMVQPSHLVDAGARYPGVTFGCATYSNLAAMLARPADLVAPKPYAGADAATAAAAVRRFAEDRIKPLNSTSTSAATSAGATP
ncbi:hypothetical protein PTE30175_00841 [Pandoraea terrae]|uniref:Lipoprotein n=1 Tax=Pandoraea terrae TaxID=1537710 RepID=A0A5E4SNV2_9BURK|nr:CpaD family pilus assembly lipoprotein [Pandoraea terrae]VVD76573.1 hypothetical protein PTE30175_00841 [Pandoraea terrae]